MHSQVISIFTWYYDDIKADLREMWLYDTAVMCIITLSFLAHEKVISTSD